MIEPTTKTRKAKRGTAKLTPFMLQEPALIKPAIETPKRGRPRLTSMTEGDRHKVAMASLKTAMRKREVEIAEDFTRQIDWYQCNKLELEEALATKEAFLTEALKRVATFEQLERKVEDQEDTIRTQQQAINRATQDVLMARSAAFAMRQVAFPRGPEFSWEGN